ncbi:hypothetical protein HGO34_13420 [Agrobacterium vitis]|uniref:Uncharacterized protein n=1 Tax=Agrobacterium vitis TaxID=373 RepID=A0AAE4WE41_AGRVI|nr:hypothetical protein [Agrobacterium vitis]MCF1499647.1 hypothetical protein [Allorhizobium sp. Av2]MCM2440715.1 hypothetical protein [Agrobacterium vitis]MUZ59306.1 hypothetical protein [Agrobacterium vitis]MVA66537.1 hypothetical protein [Agrobacterium vitis]MVA87398.1 hypothetical protein [Agrobacterium vitis]
MKTITSDEKSAAIDAWLDTDALITAAEIVSEFVVNNDPNSECRKTRRLRNEAIFSLPVLLRTVRDRLIPVETLVMNYEFAIGEPVEN